MELRGDRPPSDEALVREERGYCYLLMVVVLDEEAKEEVESA